MFNNDYLNNNKIPQLFKALSDSLVLEQPADSVEHLQHCLNRVGRLGLEGFIHETFSRRDDARANTCIQGPNRRKIETSSLEEGVVEDFRVLLLISSPGEIKPLGSKLSKIYNNCGYINVGKCLRERIKVEAAKGVSRWKVSKSLLNNGDFVPEDIVLEVLLDEMKKYKSKALIIIEGYPKNIKQITDFDNAIGLSRILKVCAIDSFEIESMDNLVKSQECKLGEPDCRPYSIARRIAYYKAYTLPVLKYFQDMKKLELVQSTKNNLKIFKQITELLKDQLPGIVKVKIDMKSFEEHHSKIQETREKIADGNIIFKYTPSRLLYNSSQLYTIPEPIHRKFSLANKPLIILNGPPRSGKTTLGHKLCKLLPGWYHYDCSYIRPFSISDQQETVINDCCRIFNDLDIISSFAIGIFLEHFPSSEYELRIFNENIGKVDLQIFLDVPNHIISMRYLQKKNMKNRGHEHELSHQSSSVMEDIIKYYENIMLPSIRYFYDQNISFNINGNQDAEAISSQVVSVIRSIFY